MRAGGSSLASSVTISGVHTVQEADPRPQNMVDECAVSVDRRYINAGKRRLFGVRARKPHDACGREIPLPLKVVQ